MANHEFGIMQNQPMNKERFDEYEPNKYDCIVVDDIVNELNNKGMKIIK